MSEKWWWCVEGKVEKDERELWRGKVTEDRGREEKGLFYCLLSQNRLSQWGGSRWANHTIMVPINCFLDCRHTLHSPSAAEREPEERHSLYIRPLHQEVKIYKLWWRFILLQSNLHYISVKHEVLTVIISRRLVENYWWILNWMVWLWRG